MICARNCLSAPQKAPRASEDAGKKTGFVMATITSNTLSSPARDRAGWVNPFAEIRTFFRDFFARALDPYRPELHYMRGPGPACRAKQAAARRIAR
jgi:hypothetical protein